MSKANALAGLIGNYGDSDEDSDGGGSSKAFQGRSRSAVTEGVQGFGAPPPLAAHAYSAQAGAIHPAPIPHCPWSACYDENSGFTYYWNQNTNAVTWEAPPEYLLALKLAQQQLHTSGSTEVSAEEWQLYQQALAEKQKTQTKVISKPPAVKPVKKSSGVDKNSKAPTKRRISDDEEEKIELITSYHHSDSDSNDEQDTPVKAPIPAPIIAVTAPKPPKLSKVQTKKSKTKSQPKEYGPSLPPNQNYTVPIGPEIPPELLVEPPKEEKNDIHVTISEESDKPKPIENEDSQDESLLLSRLKNKAKLLEKLGGELPAEIQEIIRDETNSKPSSPKVVSATIEEPKPVGDIDDLLQEIEEKELPKVKTKTKLDILNEEVTVKKTTDSAKSSPRSNGTVTPPREEVKPLFPSSKNIVDVPTTSLFPSVPVQENGIEKEVKENLVVTEKKGTNLYLMGAGEVIENTTRKKLRISNSVLPPKKIETPAYTTKYAQFIEGFTSERTGLGFSKGETEEASPKNAISYGNGLMFTKGETLNEDKKDDELDDEADLVEAKLRYLSQLQPIPVSPVQEMVIQMQTLVGAYRGGALAIAYWRRWLRAAAAALLAREAQAAPPGWRTTFQRSEGRYRYERESDGLVQWEYPAAAHCDMEICTTPPPPPAGPKEEPLPPLPATPPPPPPPPARPRTPPPPAWNDPPPPGCDEPAPPLPPEPKQEIGDELLSFYNDIAQLEKQTPSAPHTASNSPEPPPVVDHKERKDKEREREKEKERERSKDKEGKIKKKSKVKISSSIGMKQKSVSNLVAKWQQVAEEINSD